MPALHCRQYKNKAGSCCHSPRLTDVLDFFLLTDSMLVIKFVPDGIKKCIRNCKNMLKKSFWKNLEKIMISPYSPIPSWLIFSFFLVFWRYYCWYLSSKTLVTFPPFLIPYYFCDPAMMPTVHLFIESIPFCQPQPHFHVM